MQHQRGDGGFEPIEDTRHHRQRAEGNVDPRQPNQDEQRGQHKQSARHDAAPGAVHQPADVDRELLRLGAGQQHAIVQRVQKALFADPAFLLDQLGVHDGDLPGRATETDEAELKPEAKRFVEADGGRAWGDVGR